VYDEDQVYVHDDVYLVHEREGESVRPLQDSRDCVYDVHHHGYVYGHVQVRGDGVCVCAFQ
jgi:hypothetical protein